jgi:hypothetical protein
MQKITLKFITNLLVMLSITTATAFAQTASISPSNASIVVGASQSFTVTTSDFGGNGIDRSFTYNISGPGATIPASPTTFNCTSGCNTESHSIQFPTAGVYTVSVTVTRTEGSSVSVTSASRTVTVFQPNLYAAPLSRTDGVQAYKIDPTTGAIQNGPATVFVPSVTTYALGKNKVSSTDAFGCLYYIQSGGSNSGVANIYAAKPDGSSNVSVGSIDLNGSSNSTLGFVRLGFHGGKGYIIAGDGSNIYFVSFQGNGTNSISGISSPISLTIPAPGNASDFQSGDLAITSGGNLYAVASITGGNTYMYVLNSLTAPSTLTRTWTIQANGGSFGANVNGVAWTSNGSMHISAENGLYFLNQATANTGAGTVQATLISNSFDFSDLASDATPQESTLPISFGTLSVKKAGSGANVTWSTLSEFNNDYFVVERSIDGVTYTAAGTVKGAGNSSTLRTYNFTDPTLSAKVVYYRIRQVDLDRKQNISSTVSLRLDGIRIKNYTAYPNPFTTSLRIQLESAAQELVQVRLINTTGQVLRTLSVNIQKGDNTIVLPQMESVKTGLYYVELLSSEGIQTQKIYKQ